MKVLIFGASGSGTTTLGNNIEKKTDFVHLDVDNYYWKQTEPPFQEKIPLAIRNEHLKTDFNTHENVVISGSMVSWGKEWETAFDLAIFIHMDAEKRIKRLENREVKRYGNTLITDKNIQQTSKAFLEWAKQYDNPNFDGRSLKIHMNWIELLDCNVMRIDGEMELNEKTKKVLIKLKNYQK